MKMRAPLFETYPPFDELQEPDEDMNIGLVECKFWKETQEAAKRFHCLYTQAIVPLEVVVALCTGDFDGKSEIGEILAEITKAIGDIYPTGYCKEYSGSKCHDIIEKIALASNPGLVCLRHKTEPTRVLLLFPMGVEIDFEMLPDKLKGRYLDRDDMPMLKKKVAELQLKSVSFTFSEKTLDDIFDWLDANKIIDHTSLAKARSLLQGVRGPIFNGNPILEHRLILVKSLLKHSRYIYYDDARELLFPNKDLRKELEASCGTNAILYYIPSSEDKQYLFEIKALMKWLIIEKKLDTELKKHFPELVKEAIKQAVFDCPELWTLPQLKEYLRIHTHESQDIRWHVEQEVYPAYIQSHSDNTCFYSERTPLESVSKSNYKTRYSGIERLKHPHDDTYGIFQRLLKGETIEAAQSSMRAYDLDSTSDEIALGLFRFIRPKRNLSQEDLVFIKNEVKAGLTKLQKEDSDAVNYNAMPASFYEIKDHINEKFDEQNTFLTSIVNTSTQHISTPEFVDDLVAGRKVKQQRSNAAKDAAAKSKHDANKRAEPYLAEALEEAKGSPRYYSARSLSIWVCKQIRGALRAGAIGGKIRKDGRFEPYLKLRNPTKPKEVT